MVADFVAKFVGFLTALLNLLRTGFFFFVFVFPYSPRSNLAIAS